MAEKIGTNVTETAGNAAENSGGDPSKAVTDSVNSENAVSTNEGAEKTFTQSELDAIVRQRLERAAKNQPSKDELAEFREWRDSQKTAEQRAAEALAAAKSEAEAVQREKNRLEIKISCLARGVAADAADDVIALAERFVDDSTTVEKAVEKVLEKYPSFRSAKAPGITTGTKTVVSESAASSVGFFDIARENQVKRK